MNEYYKTCKFAKPKIVKHKRKTVSKETYNLVYETCQKCVLCGRKRYLQLHHVRYRSERPDLIDEPSNCLMLCINCHSRVHNNKDYWQGTLLEIAKEIYKNGSKKNV